MLASTKNSSLTACNARIRTLYNKVIQTGVTYRIVYESVEKNLWKSNPKRDLVQTEKEARNTSDSNKRGILEREIEDLINGINALEDDHLEILKNLEIRRIDVLELLSSKKRIQMYESILHEELNSI
ncbi:unnamed protein product [Schistosoma rodhaini]|uniref:Uncharacterized protein n=1 Tax=Schistosoma rodhaini TaxID=6188 RepID=A0AA85GGK6_9TREM|nr:unnamed protein product [Schistosoma rodhaini]